MANALLIAPLNAANFESGAAADGQVLTADGAGGAAWEDAAGGLSSAHETAGAVKVTTGGSARVCGVYIPTGTKNGKTSYGNPEDGDASIYWDGSAWIVDYDGGAYYSSTEDVATPDLVSGWTVDEEGMEPTIDVSTFQNYPDGYVYKADGDGVGHWVAPAGFDSAYVFESSDVLGEAVVNIRLMNGGPNGIPAMNSVYIVPVMVFKSNMTTSDISWDPDAAPENCKKLIAGATFPSGQIFLFERTNTIPEIMLTINNSNGAQRTARIFIGTPHGYFYPADVDISGGAL